MIIDQLTAIPSPQGTDELPIERGTLTFKITYDDLVGDAIGDVSTLSGFTATDLTGAANELKAETTELKTFVDVAVIQAESAFPLPATANASVTKTMDGITEDHVLIQWNFSSSAENAPPVDLTWTTANGSFTITNTSGSTSESIQPVFALPIAVAVT